MKRIALTLILLLAATSLFAGGKECQAKAAKARTVELTGTLAHVGNGEVFRVANSDQTYHVCEKTKASILGLSNGGKDTLRVKGKVVNCSGSEELLIDEAKKL